MPISLENIILAFLILPTGIILAFATLLLEKIWTNKIKNQSSTT
jgi:hypothetical protein